MSFFDKRKILVCDADRAAGEEAADDDAAADAEAAGEEVAGEETAESAILSNNGLDTPIGSQWSLPVMSFAMSENKAVLWAPIEIVLSA